MLFNQKSAHRSDDDEVLFSGDMTDGASELFYLKRSEGEAKILVANFYNFGVGNEVACKILVAEDDPEDFALNYMVARANINITKKQRF